MSRRLYTVFVAQLALMQMVMAAPTTSTDITSLNPYDQDSDLILVPKPEDQHRSLSPIYHEDWKHVKEARGPLPSHQVRCGADDRSPQSSDVEAGIRALHAKGGPVVLEEGRATFGDCDVPVESRIRRASIWVCNRTGRDSLTLSSWSMVADAAQLIVDDCKRQGIHAQSEGEISFPDGWTVSVRMNLFQFQ